MIEACNKQEEKEQLIHISITVSGIKLSLKHYRYIEGISFSSQLTWG